MDSFTKKQGNFEKNNNNDKKKKPIKSNGQRDQKSIMAPLLLQKNIFFMIL